MRTAKTDQTGRTPRVIWVFAGRTLTLLVLPCRGSFELFMISVSITGPHMTITCLCHCEKRCISTYRSDQCLCFSPRLYKNPYLVCFFLQRDNSSYHRWYEGEGWQRRGFTVRCYVGSPGRSREMQNTRNYSSTHQVEGHWRKQVKYFYFFGLSQFCLSRLFERKKLPGNSDIFISFGKWDRALLSIEVIHKLKKEELEKNEKKKKRLRHFRKTTKSWYGKKVGCYISYLGQIKLYKVAVRVTLPC